MRLSQPATQRFGIAGQETASASQRNQGHRATPFVLLKRRTTNRQAGSREISPEVSRELSREKRPDVWSEISDRLDGAGFEAAAAMIIASPILMSSAPERPATDQRRRGRSRPDQSGPEATHFAGGQSYE